MGKVEKYFTTLGLKADVESIRETIELLNELNQNLERAKTLIEELAQKKVYLELDINPSSQEEFGNNSIKCHVEKEGGR